MTRKRAVQLLALAGAAVVAVPLLYFGFWAVVLSIAFPNPCGYELKQEAVSPDRANKAAVVEVNCGATTGYVSWAVLAPAGRPYDYKKDHVATVDGDAMRVAWDASKLIVFWRADPMHADRPARLTEPANKNVELRSF